MTSAVVPGRSPSRSPRPSAPQGEAVGFDISAGLLELARARAAEAGCTNVRFVELDVQTAKDDDGPFDVVASQFGVMFFDEPTRALRALRERLTPSGRLVFACWQGVERNPWHVGTVLRPLAPAPRTPAPGKSPVGPVRLRRRGVRARAARGRRLRHRLGRAARDHDPRRGLGRHRPGALSRRWASRRHARSEAEALVARHLERFAVAPDQFEFPLAFMVYEAAA